MPGTEGGVDVYPADSRPLDYPSYADRLKDFGTAIRAGETAMVTKIRVKSKHVEFQLDGGGYGTMGDETRWRTRARQGSSLRYGARLSNAMRSGYPSVARKLAGE